MKGRIASSVVVATAILIGTAGCNLIAPQATTEHYFASDGINVDVGSLAVRNAVIISDDGDLGNLVFTVENTTDEAAALRIQYQSGDSKRTRTVAVKAHQIRLVGSEGADRTITLSGIDTQPGGLFPVYFQTGQSGGREERVPVLNGGLPEYSDLVPKG